jgi:hypothetical protein
MNRLFFARNGFLPFEYFDYGNFSCSNAKLLTSRCLISNIAILQNEIIWVAPKYVYASKNGVQHAHGSSNHGCRISLPSRCSARRRYRCIMRYHTVGRRIHMNAPPGEPLLCIASFAASHHPTPRLAMTSYASPSFASTRHDFLRISILRPESSFTHDSPSVAPTRHDFLCVSILR